MKPFDKFLGRMMDAARLVHDKGPQSATEVIQQALKDAGLLPSRSPSTHSRSDDELIDINPPPQSLQKERNFNDPVPGNVQRLLRTPPRSKQRRAPVADPRAPGEFLHGSFACSYGKRRYKLYVPSTPPCGPRPLIVMLHGCTQGADDFAIGTAMNVLAEQRDCLVLYPVQDRSANATLCWNWFEEAHQKRDSGEPALIAGMTRYVMERHHANPERVFVAGLSAGGAMAAVLGATYPDVYAAIGVHSGLPVGKARDLITGLAAMKKATHGRKAGRVLHSVPVIVFHGNRDAVVHRDNGLAVLEQFVRPLSSANGEPLRREQERSVNFNYTKTTVLDGNGSGVAEHWDLHGAGHAWSGGSAEGSYTDPAGPNASAEMLRFFLDQPIHNRTATVPG